MKIKFLHEWRENYRVFRFYFRKYRKFYLYGIGALVVVDGLEVVPPLLLMAAVNGVTEKPYGDELRTLLLKLVVAYMAVALVQGYMRYLWRKFIVRTSMFASHDMRNELFIHLSSMSPGFFQKKRVGDLVSLSTNDIEAVRFSLGPGALLLFDSLFYFLAIPPIMFWISPELTVLSFLPLLIVPFFVRRMEGFIQKRFREVQDRFSDLASHCQEAIGGIRIVKGAALEPFKEREFAQLGENYKKANLKSARTQSKLTAGLEGILSASTTVLFLVGGAFVINEKISIGVFVAFQRYIGKMAWPMEGIGLAANIFQRSIASQKRVDEVMLQEAGILEPKEPKALPNSSVPLLEVKNLSFTFPGNEHTTLENVSFRLHPGMKLGIAGGVGSGKSTLLACIAKMNSVAPGSIFFDGIDTCDLSSAEIRKRIAIVPQETFLFSRSIGDNLLYGSPAFSADDATKKREAQRSAALAALDKEVDRLPRGYDSVLGERGTNLSGGQRQRLTIARAIARNPQLMLLDDCMSAIDSETEHRLIEGILQASRGISLILASHRISSFVHMDWILLMDAGKIVAQGRPADMIRSNSTLAELARKEQQATWDLLK
jgi:ATP-binding cassette subfamily B multidrug efflux pump